MIKASVSYNGAHKWAQAKMLKPVDFKFIFSRLFEAFFILFTGAYITFIMSFSVIYAQLGSTLIFTCCLEVFWIWNMVSAFAKRHNEKRNMLAEGSDGVSREFTINENGIFYDFKSDDEWGNAMIRFDGVLSACETAEFFVFSIDRGKAFSIAKKEITEGSAEELSAMFQDRLGSRFRRRAK